MPSSNRRTRPAMYNTPTLRNGGFGALQVEAVTNRPLSIARRHLAASQLRIRDIEPDQLTSSEWVQFLVMEERERERWIADFTRRRRRGSDESTASSSSSAPENGEVDGEETAAAVRPSEKSAAVLALVEHVPSPLPASTGTTPSVSLWARRFDAQGDAGDAGENRSAISARRPRHVRRAATEGAIEAPPTYESAVRARTPPPAYEPRSDEE